MRVNSHDSDATSRYARALVDASVAVRTAGALPAARSAIGSDGALKSITSHWRGGRARYVALSSLQTSVVKTTGC